MMNVKIIQDKTCGCKCKEWKSHWINNSKKLFNDCSASNCDNESELIKQVVNFNSINNNEYIIPLCKKHSQMTKDFTIDDRNLIESSPLPQCGNAENISLM